MQKKEPKQRNYVVKKMIDRSQSAGFHKDHKKELEKYLCRENIDKEFFDEEEDLNEVSD